jgi:hypothetical protein
MLIIIAESRHKCQKSMHYPVYAGLREIGAAG